MFRSARTIGALVAVALLAGCATVPTSGPVDRHTPQATGVNSGVRIDPLPPADGASPLLVVEGFLHAMSVYQADYAVARQYLTPSASAAWHPESGVQVYADGVPPAEYGLSAPMTGTIDADGVYRPGPGTVRTHNFQLVKDDGAQWRISNPPEGLLVSRYVFTTGFAAVSLHFLDRSGTTLVPDPRYFATGDQALEEAARAQLAGPSAWLAPAVRSLDLAGVGVASVTVDDEGTAVVVLDGAASSLDAEARRDVLAELTYTLTGFAQVSAVQVSAAGQVWRDDSGQAVVRPQAFSALSPSGSPSRVLYLVREHKLARIRDTTTWGDPTPVDTGLSRPEQVAVSPDLTQVAATTQGATRLEAGQAGTDKARVVRTGTGLLRPVFARNGELWSPAASGASALEVYKGEQKLKVVVDGVPAQRVRAFALSPDGSRAALILMQGDVSSVGLVRVERTDGAIAITGWQSIDLALNPGSAATSLDIGWSSPTQLGVLRTSDSQTGVVQLAQDGSVATDIGPSEDAELSRLAVAPGGPAVALGANGDVYRFGGEFNWNLALTGVDAVAYSG